VVVLLDLFENVGKARHCCSFEHMFRLPRKSGGRQFFDEAKKKKKLEAHAP